jgi:hypothetical protein
MSKVTGPSFSRFWMVVACVCLLLPAATVAQLPWLSGAQIEKALAGRTIDGMYATGRRFTEHYVDGGALEYMEDGVLLKGRWSVTAGTLCTIYDTDPTGGCFRVLSSGSNCYEFYFVARDENQARSLKDDAASWTARGAVEGPPEACPGDANV